MTNITIAAVGDILMKGSIIDSARTSKGGYSFAPVFHGVSRIIRKHDLAIGNLETTFSGRKLAGRKHRYERRSKKTRCPLFNCPDALAPVLKKAGFDVLTTANNHSMDCGAAGLRRTLKVLDKNRLRHTGTSRSLKESRKLLVVRVKGIKVGILAYTIGTNRIPPPKPWLVNRIGERRMLADLGRLRKRADLIIVCLHFGQEYVHVPNVRQKRLVRLLFKHGANAVIGAHPHVVQPVAFAKVKDRLGVARKRLAAYSLGNFVSSPLFRNPYTLRGLILGFTVKKNRKGVTDIVNVRRYPTVVKIGKSGKRKTFRVVLR
ncbi:CapA family protein [Paenibacillus thermotolerans]|uniref:CapA family protein n=1 Tax=Paenibacillus thermotolerans TaxID=3027807 RepID=UPI002367C139|nr:MULTISPECIES: CapA family protein [unclassified Paenibacillus]